MKCDCVELTKMGLNGEKKWKSHYASGTSALPSSGLNYGQRLSQFGMIIVAILDVLTPILSSNNSVLLLFTLGLVLTRDKVRRPYDSDTQLSQSCLSHGLNVG